MGALNPRILDLPERTKTAVVQFLCVVVPHCGRYFEEGKNMWAFLGRMACVLGALGTKPTPALLAAGLETARVVIQCCSFHNGGTACSAP